MSEGHVPDLWKVAILTPILKKYGLDLVFENFRPVSNFSFVAKLRKRQLTTNYSSTNQSSYREFHFTETALLKVHNDILLNMDQQEVTLLVLLDLSAAFDIIDHEILIDT